MSGSPPTPQQLQLDGDADQQRRQEAGGDDLDHRQPHRAASIVPGVEQIAQLVNVLRRVPVLEAEIGEHAPGPASAPARTQRPRMPSSHEGLMDRMQNHVGFVRKLQGGAAGTLGS